MAESKETLRSYYLKKPYGLLEIIRHLRLSPGENLTLGVDGGDQITVSPQEAVQALRSFQAENFPEKDQISDFSSSSELQKLELLTINFIRADETTALDPELRESILRNWRRHQEENRESKEERNLLHESIRSAEGYWQEKLKLERLAQEKLKKIEESSRDIGVKNYISVNRRSLTQDLASSLESLSSQGAIDSYSLERSLIGTQGSAHWNTLESLMIREDTSLLPSVINETSQETSSVPINQEALEKGQDSLQLIRERGAPRGFESLSQAQKEIESWGAINNLSDEEIEALSGNLQKSIHKHTVLSEYRSRPWDRIFGNQTNDKILERSIKEAAPFLSEEDISKLSQTLTKNTDLPHYIYGIKEELVGNHPQLLYTSPVQTEAYLVSKGSPPQATKLFLQGLTYPQIQNELLALGYSNQEAVKAVNDLVLAFQESRGFAGTLYKLRANWLNTTGSIRMSIVSFQEGVRQRINNLPPVKFARKVQEALRPINLPIVGDAIRAYAALRSNISERWNSFLDKNMVLGYFLSSRIREKVFHNIVASIAKNSRFKTVRLGATLFKNGGYSWYGFRRQLGVHIRTKIGNWLLEKARQKGVESLVGGFAAWLGKGLVSGTLTGGLSIAIGGAIYIWRNRKQIEDFIKNFPEYAAMGIKAFLPLVAFLQVAATSIVGAILGALTYIGLALAGIVSFSFAWLAGAIVIGAVTLNLLAPIFAWVQGAVAALVQGIGAAASSIGAFFSSVLSSALPTGAIATTSVVGGVAAGWVAMTLFSQAQITAGIPGDPHDLLPGLEGTGGSQYIVITKSAQAAFDGENHISNANLNQTIQYTISVEAVEKTLTGVTITDTSQVFGESGEREVGSRTETTDTLVPGQPYEFSYELGIDSSFKDSYLTNSVEVRAESDEGEEIKTVSLNIAVGDPPVLPAALFAQRLAQALSQYCTSNGEITLSDGGACLRQANDPQINSVIPILVESASRFQYLQCVGFARAAMVGTGGSLGTIPVAADYITSPPAGYSLVSSPVPGDLFVIGRDIVPGTGHVGVVVQVAGDVIHVADANSNGHGIARANAVVPIGNVGAFLRR